MRTQSNDDQDETGRYTLSVVECHGWSIQLDPTEGRMPHVVIDHVSVSLSFQWQLRLQPFGIYHSETIMNNTTSSVLQPLLELDPTALDDDTVGSMLFIAVVIVWYSSSAVLLLAMNGSPLTDRADESCHHAAKCVRQHLRDRSNNKTILGEFSKEVRRNTWLSILLSYRGVGQCRETREAVEYLFNWSIDSEERKDYSRWDSAPPTHPSTISDYQSASSRRSGANISQPRWSSHCWMQKPFRYTDTTIQCPTHLSKVPFPATSEMSGHTEWIPALTATVTTMTIGASGCSRLVAIEKNSFPC